MKFEGMKLQEKHKEFVVKHFARFRKLTDIVDEFMDEFKEDLPTPELQEIPDLEEYVAETSTDEELYDKDGFIEDFIKKHKEEFEEQYSNEADKKLNAAALENFEESVREECRSIIADIRRYRKKSY